MFTIVRAVVILRHGLMETRRLGIGQWMFAFFATNHAGSMAIFSWYLGPAQVGTGTRHSTYLGRGGSLTTTE